MESTTIWLLLGLFAIAHLLISYWTHPRQEEQTLAYFALAGRKMSTGLLALTFLATILDSRELIGKITQLPAEGGAYASLQVASYLVAILCFLRFVLKRFSRFRGCYTLSHIIAHTYGKPAARISRWLLLGINVGLIVSQLIVLADLGSLLGIDGQKLILFIGLMVVLYVAGGVRTIAWTHLLQMAILSAALLWITTKVLAFPNTPLKALPQGVNFEGKEGLPGLWVALHKNPFWSERFIGTGSLHFIHLSIAGLFYSLLWLSSPMIQRTLIARNKQQIERAGFGVALLYPLLSFLLTLIGCALAIVAKEERYKDSYLAIVSLFSANSKYFLHVNWGIFVCASILIVVVTSTIGSFLAAAALECFPLYTFNLLPEESPSKQKNFPTAFMQLRILIGILGLLSIGLTLLLYHYAYIWRKGQIDYTYISDLSLVALSLLVSPTIMAACGLKGNGKIFLQSMLTQLVGLQLFFLTDYYNLLGKSLAGTSLHTKYQYASLFGVFLGLITLLLTHYKHYGQLLWEAEYQPRKPFTFHLYKHKDPLLLFRKPLQWAKNALHHANIAPLFLGYFLLITRLIPGLVPPIRPTYYDSWFLIVRMVTLALSMGLIFYKGLDSQLNQYTPFYWLFAIGFTLIFDPLLTLLYNPQDPLAQLHLIFGLLLLMRLVDHQSWLVVTGLFGGASLLAYWATCNKEHWTNEVALFSVLWPIGLSLFYTLMLGFLFIARTEEDTHYKIVRYKVWCQNLLYETNTTFQNINWEVNPANQQGIPYQLQALKQLRAEVKDKAKFDKISSAITTCVDYTRKNVKDSSDYAKMLYHIIAENGLNPREIFPVHIGSLVDKAYQTSSSDYRELIKVIKGEDGMVKVSPTLVVSVLKHIIKNAVWHGGATAVNITWHAKKGRITITDNGTGIPSHVLPYIFEPGFSAGSGGMGIGLAYSKMVIEGMHGSIEVTTSSQGTTFTLKLLKGREPAPSSSLVS